ncbi:MAG: hypothetical protein F6K09_34585, partial [Merismopedia sp. SIO2A8]|nr:hypothetical protein [Merismopedia sp. SIO2A8]
EFATQASASKLGEVSSLQDPRLLSTSCQTQVIHSHTTAPLKIQRPFYPEGRQVCHSVMLHTAGGMVGGDRLQQSLKTHPNAHALVTTAAANKVYRSNGPSVYQSISMHIDAGACLEWLPQELILFDGARYEQHLKVELGEGAHWFGWDITRLGRTARGETFNQGQWRSHLEIWREGYPLLIDPQHIEGGSEMMTSAHGLAHCPVIGTFVMIGQAVDCHVVEQARQSWTPILQSHAHGIFHRANPEDNDNEDNNERKHPTPMTGVSQLQSGMICRYRGRSTIQARRWFIAVWDCLRKTYLSRPSCLPRVWC